MCHHHGCLSHSGAASRSRWQANARTSHLCTLHERRVSFQNTSKQLPEVINAVLSALLIAKGETKMPSGVNDVIERRVLHCVRIS